MTKFLALCLTLVLATAVVQAEVQVKSTPAAALPEMPVEQSTESPIADMALIEDAPMVPKTPTEKPPTVAAVEAKVTPAPPSSASDLSTIVSELPQADEKSAQPHTVADFIIHPLIAFKPRQAALDELHSQGKQATGGGASGATPSSPGTWLFGMNPGQGLGSSFSTLAGSVSGWFNDRLAAAGQQLPGLPALVDTPVRESASTTSTTTTQRPDIVVRVQQRPNRRRGNGNGNGNGNSNGDLNGNNNKNRNGNRVQRPNRFNNRLDSFESDEYDDDYFNGNRYDEEFDDDELEEEEVLPHDDEQSVEQGEDDDEEQLEQQSAEQQPIQKQRRRPVQAQSQTIRRKQHSQSQSALQSQRRQLTQQQQQQQTRRGHPLALLEQADEDEEDDDAEQELEDDEEADDSEENYEPVVYTQSSRKSQGQSGFIQNGQQSIINQLRRFTFGQTPAEVGNKLRKSSSTQSPYRAGTRRPQQATLLVNRNGQTVYVAPELLNLAPGYPYGYVSAPAKKQQPQLQQHQRLPASSYPQPPLTVPVRRKGRPTQYITIPWRQLGLSPPDRQSVVSLAEGIQSQPLILNIPESAISTLPVRGGSTSQQKKKKRPTLTAAAVPLLTDASLMDIFQPPQIPPSRTGSSSGSSSASTVAKPKPKPVLIAAKPVQTSSSAGLLPTRIRPGTIVEKAPVMDTVEKPQVQAMQSDQQQQQPQKDMSEMPKPAVAVTPSASSELAMEAAQQLPEQEYIIVGEDNEPGLSRHVQPVYGDARYVSYGDFQPYFDLVHQNRRFALRKVGRALHETEHNNEGEIIADSPIVKV